MRHMLCICLYLIKYTILSYPNDNIFCLFFNQTDKISIESFSTKRVWSLDLLIAYYLHLLTFQNGVQAQAYSSLLGSFHRGRKYISSYFPFLAIMGTTGSLLRCSGIVFLVQQSSLRIGVQVTSLSEQMVCLLFICTQVW